MELERGLPCNLDAERIVLGSILIGSADILILEAALAPTDFAIEKHRRIYQCALDLAHADTAPDRATVTNALSDRKELESCDGLSYLIDLDNNTPRFSNIDAWIEIVREKSTLRKLMYAAQSLLQRCAMGEDQSREILSGAESMLLALGQNRQNGQWLQPGEIIERFPGGFNAFANPQRGGNGIPMPWPNITEDLCGFHAGDLFVVAGRPSMGKSIAMMQMAHCAAAKDYGAAVISLEMSKESLMQRLLCSVARVDSQKLRAGYTSADERLRLLRAYQAVEKIPLYVDDTHLTSAPEITAAVRKLVARHPIHLIFIDHLQLMKSVAKLQNRHEQLSETTHALKHLAAKTETTVVLLSQLNRECEKEKRAPRLSDLRESGTIEEDADVVMFVHRPEMYHRDREDLRGVAEFIIGKQRNGPTGKRQMIFLNEIQKFENRANDLPYDEE
jgi:replicative DNA helicase